MRAHGRTAAIAAAALLAATLAVMAFVPRPHPGPAGGRGEAAPLPVRRAPSTLPAASGRPVWRPVAGDSLTAVASFTRLGDTLVVLDPLANRVLLLITASDAWRVVGAWGRKGGGPGELQRPLSIAALPGDTIAVAEQGGRVQLFTADGRYRRTDAQAHPCQMFAPTIAYARDGGRWLAGNCAGSGASVDTIFTMVFHAPHGGAYREVLRRPRMALNLSWGTVLATMRPLSDAGSGVWLGTGLDDCAQALAGPLARERCGLVLERLSAPEPPGLAAQRRQAEQRGDRQTARLLRWPDALPPYFGLVMESGTGERGVPVLVRPVASDSVVLVPAGGPFDPALVRLVAPLRSFVQCVRGACLWFDADAGRLALHDAHGRDVAVP